FGLLLKDRYPIEREIGRGGIGRVYLARDRQLLSRPVVIKVLVTASDDPAFIDWFHKKFRQEMEALVRINHPGVVAVLDSGEMPDGKPFLVMQYVEGITLRTLMDISGMEFARVARIAQQIGHALAAAHGKGVCHRDLKPENVMIEQPGREAEQVKLIDFGVARVDDSLVATSAERTWVAGTPPYMAPEQLRGQPTFKSDIYSFGALAYEMLTGRTPFNAATTVDLYELQRNGEFTPPSQVRRSLPEAAQAAIMRALSFHADDRHPTALAFGEDLARALSGAPVVPATMVGTSDDRVTDVIPPRARETFPSLPPHRRAPADRPAPARSGRRTIAFASTLLIALAALLFFIARNRQTTNVQTVAPAPVQAERALEYWIVAQKYRNRKPYGAPFKLPGAIFFEAGDHFFLHLSVSQPGYFYLINEGPRPASDLPDYNVLFPKPGVNNGSALLAVNQELTFPERGEGFVLDQERGTEKLWLAWSEASVPELEAVKSVVNAKQQSMITDPAQIRSVRDYLAKAQAESQASPRIDKEKSQTRVTTRGSTLIHRIELLHY
ncbi:MAG: protein kinase domain-containing protein, partial [Blastocatellia bacterium]